MLYSFYRYLKVYKVFSVRKNIKQAFFADFYVQILIRAGNIWEPPKKKTLIIDIFQANQECEVRTGSKHGNETIGFEKMATRWLQNGKE